MAAMASDIQKNDIEAASVDRSSTDDVSKPRSLWERIVSDFFETRGIEPVAEKDRQDTRYINLFTLWMSVSLSVLPIPFGILGTATFGLSLRDASLTILFFSLLTALPVAYIATLGPKFGMRSMIIARYTFGRYLVSIPVLLNVATLTGFCVITDVLGGGILAAASSEGAMSWNVGIVIVGLVCLFIAGLGYRIMHYFERFAWMAALICLIILAGVSGKNLRQAEAPPATAQSVLSFGGLMAGYFVPWAAIGSDFSTYMHPKAPPTRIFLYTYLGILLPSIPILIFGAAIGGSLPNNPTWAAAHETGSIGAILDAMLASVGRFGKFLLVVLAFSVIGNQVATIYAVALNFQALIPWLIRVPRYIFVIIATIIVIPLAVEAAKTFFVAIENFVGIIGYWTSCWATVVLAEHFVFRRRRPENYELGDWNNAKVLPMGAAATLASALAFALIIPAMSQVWYTGPIGKRAGDVGFEIAFVLTFVLYVPLRYAERRFSRQHRIK